MTMLGEARLLIDGEWREAEAGRFDVINPYDESIVGQAENGSVEDVASAITAARRAFDDTEWSRDHALRRHCLLQLRDRLRENVEQIKRTVIAESGLCARYLSFHVDGPIEEIGWMCDAIVELDWERDLTSQQAGGRASRRRLWREPFGVAAAITPWNAPFISNLWKITHLLAAGNTMVLKTAPETPLTGALIGRLLDQTDVPDGVFNLISSADKGSAGEALTGDPRVDLFHFTGSPETGQRIAERAATGLRKAVLELGGKSANILLDDANLDEALAHGVSRCMSTSGQGCSLPTRMIVHASIYDEAVGRLTDLMRGVCWGDPTDQATVVGPIIRERQVDRMEALVRRAAEEGARIAVGGERATVNGRGIWFKPTLIVDADQDSEIAQTEVFGPVLTVLRFDGDDAEAVRIANNSRFGLANYIQTGSDARAEWIARRLSSGSVAIGASSTAGPDGPVAGRGISGLGCEHGIEGLRECLQTKTVSWPA